MSDREKWLVPSLIIETHLKIPVEFVQSCRFILLQIFCFVEADWSSRRSDIFLSPVPGSPCVPGINVARTSCSVGFLRLTGSLKWGSRCLPSYLQLLQKKRTKKVDYSAEQTHTWVRAALFVCLVEAGFFYVLLKLEVLVWKILMAKQHFK